MAARSAWRRFRDNLLGIRSPSAEIVAEEPRSRFEVLDLGYEGVLLVDYQERVEYPFWKVESAYAALPFVAADAAPFLHSFPIYTSKRGHTAP